MSKYCVKKPFTVVVAVIMVIVLGVISFTSMTTDLLPAMELPYVMVVTSYPGASPERVERGGDCAAGGGAGYCERCEKRDQHFQRECEHGGSGI